MSAPTAANGVEAGRHYRRLVWIANNLMQIETLNESSKGNEWVEITWWSDAKEDQQMTKRHGKDVEEAFFTCLDAAMAEYEVQHR